MEYYILSPILFILRIIEVLANFVLMLSISEQKFTVKKLTFCSVIVAILYEMARITVPQYLLSVLSLFLIIFSSIIILKMKVKQAVLSYLITVITLAILDILVSVFVVKISNLQNLTQISQDSTFMSIGKSIIIISMFVISLIIRILKKNNEVLDIKESTNLITLIVTFFLLFPNLLMILYYCDKKPLPFAIIIINIIAIIATFLINIYNTQRGIKLVQAEEELLTEKTYNNTLRELVDSLRTFKHDYNNMLQTMHGYIFIKDLDGLTEYFNQVLSESKTIVTLDRLKPELFRNPSLFGLVTAKFEYARKNEINMNFEIYAELDDLSIKTYDFTRILGIFLDNAIEAAISSENKIVNFYVVERDNKVTIEISNSFTENGLKIDEMGQKGKSSKGENRGLGLYKVKDILSKYPKIVHETKISSELFLQKMVIDKNNV